jgi:hypothetical protein
MLAELAPDQVCALPAGTSFTFVPLEQTGNFLTIRLDPVPACPSWARAVIYLPSFTIEAATPDSPADDPPDTPPDDPPDTPPGSAEAIALAAERIGDSGRMGAHLRAAPRMLSELGANEKCAIPADQRIAFRILSRRGDFLEIELDSAAACPSWRRGFIYRPSFTAVGGWPEPPQETGDWIDPRVPAGGELPWRRQADEPPDEPAQ